MADSDYGVYDIGRYRAVANKLGLTVDDNWHIHGVLDGMAINVVRNMPEVAYSALLPRPARVQFSIAELTLIEKTKDFFRGYSEQSSGSPAFDKRFHIQAGDAPYVARLISAEAKNELITACDMGLHALVTPQMLSLTRFSWGGTQDDVALIERDFRGLVNLAKLLSASFAAERSERSDGGAKPRNEN